MKISLDEFDVKILNEVQRNNRLSAEQLARKVCLSASAVQRRLKRLRGGGVIERDVAHICPEAVNRNLLAVVAVSFEREQTHITDKFKRAMMDAPEVMQCYAVTGEIDFIVIMTARDLQDYDAFARRFFTGNSHVKRYQTSIVVHRVKSGLTVPVIAADLKKRVTTGR
jgi:Lrp/AsnC family transcriptional regulator, leucine-responsive regulatory protein